MIAFISVTHLLSAQDIKVSAYVDKNSYLIGDYIRLKLEAQIPQKYIISWPSPEEITPFEIITSSPLDSTSSQNIIQFKQEIIYSIYDSGYYTISPVRVTYKKPFDDSSYVALSDSILFAVNTVPVDTTQTFKPIKAPVEVEVKNYTWVFTVSEEISISSAIIL